jgi:hypothetical protein
MPRAGQDAEPPTPRRRLRGMRKNVMTAAGLAACVLAAGCGSLRAGGQPGPAANRQALTASRHPAATAAGNRALAWREARHLLLLAPVPRGARPLRSVPRSLAGPAMGSPDVTSLVDAARSWRIPLPYGQATAWLRRHRPHGLPWDGSSGGTSPPVTGDSYSGPAGRAWQSAELEILLAPAGHGMSVLRADGVVTWLDPVPVRDTVRGRRMHVTVTGGCPASDAGYVGVTSSGADLNRRLVPAAAPVAGLECRYNGMNGDSGYGGNGGRKGRTWQLRRATVLTAGQARRLASSMARMPLSHVDGGVTACPMDDGSAEVIALSYPGRPDVDLWDNLTGCGGIANGHIVSGGGDPLAPAATVLPATVPPTTGPPATGRPGARPS